MQQLSPANLSEYLITFIVSSSYTIIHRFYSFNYLLTHQYLTHEHTYQILSKNNETEKSNINKKETKKYKQRINSAWNSTQKVDTLSLEIFDNN